MELLSLAACLHNKGSNFKLIRLEVNCLYVYGSDGSGYWNGRWGRGRINISNTLFSFCFLSAALLESAIDKLD